MLEKTVSGSRKQNLLKVAISLLILTLALALGAQTVNATLILKNVRAWGWGYGAEVESVAKGDVDGDGKTEIVTGGWYFDMVRDIAQLCVWEGATLALKNVQTWYWTSSLVYSIAIGDVDGDGKTEIVTGGYYEDGALIIAQLCVWNGATLALENVRTWYWTSYTFIYSVAVYDVDADGKAEIVTGGSYNDTTHYFAQLCVWNGATLTLEGVETWYWIGDTYINSVCVDDVNSDGKVEIVTGGTYHDGTRAVAQLCIWDGATLALENVRTWYWTSDTGLGSVAVGDVDGDGKTEIITDGYYYDGAHYFAQLCVWNGATLTLKDVRAWIWANNTTGGKVAVGDVDGDGKTEIVTGGWYDDGTRWVAQLCVWNGATLTLKDVVTWYWTGHTLIKSVAVGDVDGDGKVEIVTGGYCSFPIVDEAQLCVWYI